MSYYTYGQMPPELWPVRNQRPESQFEREQDVRLFGSVSEPELLAEGGMAGDEQMLPTDAILGEDQDAFLVEGDSSGRADDVDARLSPGEYVWDAETVALLGDGNTDAGAKLLDQMRVMIRKHKGAELVKGKFSPDAMSPLEYLDQAEQEGVE